ncbi:hemagglutinin domain-containing protein [Campylobacter lari]|uniref:two-partner secretion domain-containing protein n=1 Tax=Campylobacter lari TaxID=201 RepID=UPI00215325E7|nr:filamentous hemagglutinin N-terminal domain-containing protein [Campylobacter lari]MCR6525589.1 filamentous hemagglutinin N-terminal domain-containing protein [Campylobacter lari]
MKKLANHIILSGVTVSMLFSPLMALPSGGKFTHGTSGSISIDKTNPNKPIMNVSGNGANSVIQWGGGFNIANGEKVNFGNNNFKGQQNYLNIAHGTNKSTIAGILEAGNNNVFLINPNGVIITKTGTINANRFVASTSSMSDGDMWKFAKLTKEQAASFSPVFNPQKAGNVVNMGNINANDVLLIGNKVDVQGGKIGNANSTTHLVGKNVYIDVDAKLNSTINVTTTDGGYIQRQMINFANDRYIFGNNANINVINYTDSNGKTHKGSSNFKKALTIGNMGNEKDNAIEWWHFAKGWNEGLGVTREIDEFRLVGDIDFSGNQGKGVESKDWQNYANYCIDGLGCASMIVGFDREKVFTKTFDGQGFTLKNINIFAKDLDDNKPMYVGIFGYTNKAHIENVIVDYNNGGIFSDNTLIIGGIVGIGIDGVFKDVSLKNINTIVSENQSIGNISIGGFAGILSGDINVYNIQISNINSIDGIVKDQNDGASIGGFAGRILSGKYNTIRIDNVKSISIYDPSYRYNLYAGGFVGYIHTGISSEKNIILENIILSKIESILVNGNWYSSSAGGFLGYGHFAKGFYSFKNIALDDIGLITAKSNIMSGGFAGGFAGYLDFFNSANDATFENIFIYFTQNSKLEGRDRDLFSKSNGNLKINNTYAYYYKNGQFETVNNSNKINQKSYTSSNSLKQDFELKIKDIKTPNFIKNHSDVSLEEDDLISEALLNQIIADLKDKFYAVDINTLNDLLKAYSKIDKNNPASKAEFLANYLLSKDKYSDKERLDIAHSMIQSLDFLLTYQDNGLDKAGDDKFANQEAIQAKNDILAEVSTASKQANANKDKVNDFIPYLNNEVNKINSANNDFKEKNYYKQLNDLALAYNKYIELINKGLASKDDQAFKDISNKLFALIAQVGKETEAIEKLIKDFEGLKIQVSENSNGHFVFKGELSAIKIPYPILASIKDDNNSGGIEIPDKPIDPVEPPIDNKPDDSLAFEQSSTFNSIGNETLNEEEEQEEIDETSLLQKSKTCIVSDNYKTMNPCVAGM